ncbi:MAG: 4Fe-4S dicluster domain-containing protein [Elusimicrobiota bacterium]
MDFTPEPLDEKLARVTFVRDAEPHIVLDAERCRRCRIERPCIHSCPAGNYKYDGKSGQVSVSTESCMECGTCRVVCTEGAVDWKWPRGGFGVCYLHG